MGSGNNAGEVTEILVNPHTDPHISPDPRWLYADDGDEDRDNNYIVERKTSLAGKAVSDWINGETFLCLEGLGPPLRWYGKIHNPMLIQALKME